MAIVKELAGVRRHPLGRPVPAIGAGDDGIHNHSAGPGGHSAFIRKTSPYCIEFFRRAKACAFPTDIRNVSGCRATQLSPAWCDAKKWMKWQNVLITSFRTAVASGSRKDI